MSLLLDKAFEKPFEKGPTFSRKYDWKMNSEAKRINQIVKEQCPLSSENECWTPELTGRNTIHPRPTPFLTLDENTSFSALRIWPFIFMHGFLWRRYLASLGAQFAYLLRVMCLWLEAHGCTGNAYLREGLSPGLTMASWDPCGPSATHPQTSGGERVPGLQVWSGGD